ncbi:MAG: V0D/AC39 family V-type ATPase subunit [Treponema sp.]
MEHSEASAYVYAKTSGMLQKAFVGRSAERLFNAQSLSALWELIFSSPVPSVPEVMLAGKIEREALKLFIKQYMKLLGAYSKPARLLIELLRRYEIENLKSLAAAVSQGQEIDEPVRIGRYGVFNYDAWPDVRLFTKDSEYGWYDKVPSFDALPDYSFRLDVQRLHIIWRAAKKGQGDAGEAVASYIKNDYSLKNMLWVLRLRVYYNMERKSILPHLFYAEESAHVFDPFCAYAFDALDRPLDSYEAWKDWKFARFLNDYEEGVPWKINPMWVEQKIRIEQADRAQHIFHRYPMTDANLAMFFMIKLQELNCIRAAAECIRLNADRTEAMYAAGIAGSGKEGV